jgi:hypothetical protein
MERFTTYCLNEDERILIMDLINQTISDLHTEIIRTENWNYKEMLIQRRQALERIRQKMGIPESTSEYA